VVLFVREKILIRLGSRELHLVKLIGALILVGSGLMLLNSVYNLVSVSSIILGPAGESVALEFGGLSMESEVGGLDINFKAGLVLRPLAGIMFWSALFVFGTVIYRTGGITIPVTGKIRKSKDGEISKGEEDEEGEEDKEKKPDSKDDGFVCSECGRSFGSRRALRIHQTKSH